METDERCPHCSKQLRGFRDYPRIFVKNFEIFPVEEEVISLRGMKSYVLKKRKGLVAFLHNFRREKQNPDFPQEIIEQLRKKQDATDKRVYSGKFVYFMDRDRDGTECFNRANNKTEYVKAILAGKNITDLLTMLKSLVGTEVNSQEIIPPFKKGPFGYTIPDVPSLDAAVAIDEFNLTKRTAFGMVSKNRLTGIIYSLYGEIRTEGDNAHDATIFLPIARIEYEGRLNPVKS
jgi:hypothetical protein